MTAGLQLAFLLASLFGKFAPILDSMHFLKIKGRRIVSLKKKRCWIPNSSKLLKSPKKRFERDPQWDI